MSVFFIIDTNIVAAGLVTANAESPPARILDGMLSAAFAFVVSKSLLAEYRAVLLRPKLCKLHGLSTEEIDTILTDIARHAIVLNPTKQAESAPPAPDPGDQFLWDLLATRLDLVLVTGDKRLLQDPTMVPRVISAQALMVQLAH